MGQFSKVLLAIDNTHTVQQIVKAPNSIPQMTLDCDPA